MRSFVAIFGEGRSMRPPPSDGRRSLREQWNSSFTQFHKRRSSINYRNLWNHSTFFFKIVKLQFHKFLYRNKIFLSENIKNPSKPEFVKLKFHNKKKIIWIRRASHQISSLALQDIRLAFQYGMRESVPLRREMLVPGNIHHPSSKFLNNLAFTHFKEYLIHQHGQT